MANGTTAADYRFLHQLIDYAGLFPPASLALPQALANYRAYRTASDSWMLGRFIVPTAKLAEVSTLARDWFTADDPFRFAALGRSGTDSATFLAGLAADGVVITDFRTRHGDSVRVDVLETRLPALAGNALSDTLTEAVTAIDTIGGLTVFLESTPDVAAWEASIGAFIAALAALNRERAAPTGFKLRTGGVTPDAFPRPAQIAYALVACRDNNIPFKATAGLHHPIRQYRDEVQTHMHGFVNVFGAGLLAASHRLEATIVSQILEEQDPAAFSFDGDSFRWRDLHVPAATIAALRQHLLVSYGSCSFDEPRQDLRTLGYL